MHQVSPGSNHIMFNAGHIALCDANFMRAAEGAPRAAPEWYAPLYEAGCAPSDRAADSTATAVLLDVLRRAREELLSYLAGLPGGGLAAAIGSERLRSVVPTVA